jgi:C-terminal processing protease CtpA/Prc
MLRSLLVSLGVVSILVGLAGCDPVPRRTLSNDEKQADLFWVYSQFGENYAPLEYKQKKYGFDYERLKAETNAAAEAATTNDEFYAIVFKFVSTFRDAHSSAALTNSSLPDRAMTAYLGFSGVRDGETLLVQDRLPTIADKSSYPIEKGDRILKIDGRDLRTAVNADLVPWRNLGSDEANFTYHVNKLFTRVSTVNGLPSADDAVLTVRRDKRTFEVTLPWVKKDLYQFQAEQQKAKDQADQEKAKKKPADSEENFLMLGDGNGGVAFKFRFVGFDGRIELPAFNAESISRTVRKSVADGFRFIDSFASWKLVATGEDTPEKTPEQVVRERRFVPDGAVFLEGAKVYPTFVSREEKGLVATIYLDTFDPLETPENTIKEFKSTLLALQTLGVERIVIDLLNNGGGNLELGFQLAQALSPDRVALPGIQFRVSDSWLDQFESESIQAKSDSEREVSRRVFENLQEARSRGDRLTGVMSAGVLAPFDVNPIPELKSRFHFALMVNEMCASMCDIFAAMLQDDGLALVVGTQTMGAGGNVVGYSQAPNSHFDVRQTESLIVRKDGSYIENVGVTPDVVVPVANYTASKYKEVRAAAIKALD